MKRFSILGILFLLVSISFSQSIQYRYNHYTQKNDMILNWTAIMDSINTKIDLDSISFVQSGDTTYMIYCSATTIAISGNGTFGTFIKLTPLADFPGSPEEGMVVTKTDHHMYYWNGSSWICITD